MGSYGDIRKQRTIDPNLSAVHLEEHLPPGHELGLQTTSISATGEESAGE